MRPCQWLALQQDRNKLGTKSMRPLDIRGLRTRAKGTRGLQRSGVDPPLSPQLCPPSHGLHRLLSSNRSFRVPIEGSHRAVPSPLNRVRELPGASPGWFLDVYSPVPGRAVVGVAFLRCLMSHACAAARGRPCSAAGPKGGRWVGAPSWHSAPVGTPSPLVIATPLSKLQRA